MITRDQLREHIGRRPFQPFKVVLASGEAVPVTRTAQAVAMKYRLVVATPDDCFRRIWLRDITRVDDLEARHTS